MARQFTDDDRGKRVVTDDDRRVGTVSRVDDGRAYVERDDDDEGLTDKIKSWLDWGDDEDEHELRDDHVDRIDDDRVRLRRHQ